MSNNENIRVAFIGAGTIVQGAHIPGFQRLEDVETVAICDVNEARANDVAAATGIPATFTDFEQMLTDIEPDVTVIATPNVFHKPMSIAALEAGSHVLCEKPLALTYDDAVEMLGVARGRNRILTVGTHFRFTDPTQICKAHVDSGFLGRIYAARTVWQRRAGIPGYGGWFTNKALAGGGALLDIGIHALDRALYLMGYPKPISVSGISFSEFGPRGMGLGGWANATVEPIPNASFDVDDLAWAFIRLDNGAALQFQVAWASHFPEQFYTELYGTDGAAYVGNRGEVQLYTDMNGRQVTIEGELPRVPTNSYATLIANLVRKIKGDEDADIVTPDQALVSVRIIDAIMRSAASGREVTITE